MKYIPTIGLEIHLQLNTNSKMFCACSNRGESEPPNTTICPICMAHPGTLPTINREAVKAVIRAGLALHCEINSSVKLDRKNYFYPDLSKGYQISQYDLPICHDGYIEIEGKRIAIRRIHIEEDTAKMFHSPDGAHTLVDFNRAGSPLMELVTEPDCEDAETARKLSQELQKIFRYLSISDGDMEKGHMRCEANVSVRLDGETAFGTKVEVKNINSFRSLERTIEYEIKRQTELLERDEKIIQETRGWDDVNQKTISQRAKEDAHDYRYFPEPDLPPLEFSSEFLNEMKRTIPELPIQKRKRFENEYGFTPEHGLLLTETKVLAAWAEHVISEVRVCLDDSYEVSDTKTRWQDKKRELARLVGGWTTSELFKLLNVNKMSIEDIKITPENFAELMVLLFQKKINSSAGQVVLDEMFHTGKDPHDIVRERNMEQIEDAVALRSIIEKIITTCPEQVVAYKSGKTNIIQFLVGKVMTASKGKANPQKTREILEEILQHDRDRTLF